MSTPHPGAQSGPRTLGGPAHAAEQEARLVLPAMQALLGFEMISVCGQRYAEFDAAERWTNFGTLALVTLALALVIGPGRKADPAEGNGRFVNTGASFFAWAMVLLAAAIGSELYLLVNIVTEGLWFGPLLAVGACVVFAWFWFMMPLRKRTIA